jgi:hypothetical protein
MRAVRFMLAVAIAWGAQAGVSFAEANWWDHLSGPGPFVGVFADYRFLCISDSSNQKTFRRVTVSDAPPAEPETGETEFTWLSVRDRTAGPWVWKRTPEPDVAVLDSYTSESLRNYRKQQAAVDCKNDQNVRSYMFAGARFDWAYKNNLVPSNDDPLCAQSQQSRDNCDTLRPVRVFTYEVGYVFRLAHGFGIGDTVELHQFWGPAFRTFYRGSVTPLIEFAPYAAKGRTGPQAYKVRITAGASFFPRGFDSTDFCNRTTVSCAPIKAWKSTTEVVPRIAIVFEPAFF